MEKDKNSATMDDLIKEPDKMEFVDSDHILNYLQSTMEDAYDNSLMNCEGNMGENIQSDDSMNNRLSSTEGILDNLIKSVCSGIDDSTLIDKNDGTVPDKSSSSEQMVNLSPKSAQCVDDCLESRLAEAESKNSDRIFKVVLVRPPLSDEDKTKTTTDSQNISSLNIVQKGNSKLCSKAKSELCSKKESESCSKKECLSDGSKSENIDNDDDDIIVIHEKEKPASDDCEIVTEKKICTPSGDITDNENPKLNSSKTSASVKETSDHAFQINDNMKKGLSKLAFPAKSSLSRNSAQKKKIPPLRPIANTRITIGEALEKAQDAQKSISEEKGNSTSLATADVTSSNVSVIDEFVPTSKFIMKIGSFEPSESQHAFVTFGEQAKSKTSSKLELDKMLAGPSTENIQENQEKLSDRSLLTPSPSLSVEDQDEVIKDKVVSGKSFGQGKQSAYSNMTELLKFTFNHEHFPSSVHMARLAKMMGVTWSQVRNWFTKRRIENKKNGIFPRDKVLYYCHYCDVSLKTEAEQKGHLFASQHIKKILGPEFISVGDIEGTKWKHPSQDESSISNISQQNLPIGSPNNLKDRLLEGEEILESANNKLGKRWKKSFLLNDGSRSVGHTSNKNKVDKRSLPPDCDDSELTIKDEDCEELYSDTSYQEVGLETVRVEEYSNNLENLITRMDDINSQQLSQCTSAIEKGTMNKKFTSSQTGRYASTKVIGQSSTKGSRYAKDKVKNLEPEATTRNHCMESSSNSSSNLSKRHFIRQKESIAKEKDSNFRSNLGKGNFMKQKEVIANEKETVLGFKCPKCIKIFQTEWQMMKHSMTHLIFMCDLCERTFPSEDFLKMHLHDHLTSAYEEEKYYCQFSCKVCHSLKCECYEPQVFTPKNLPEVYKRSQKAKRSKKTFSTKPFSGPNDHLKVTFGGFQKYLQSSVAGKGKMLPHKILTEKMSAAATNNSSEFVMSRLERKVPEQRKRPMTEQNKPSTSKEEIPLVPVQPKLSVRKDLLAETSNQSNKVDNSCDKKKSTIAEEASSLSTIPGKMDNLPKTAEKENETQRKGRGRPIGRRNTPREYVYMDADFYYMCEICDSSFLSKAELQEHMFFHRLKSRSRRGEKRSLEVSEESVKKSKVDSCVSEGEAQTINVVGFERFKCPKCKGHFANVTDLNRHKTQAHSDDLSGDSLEVLKCNYCEKTYRRERELRRHLKHACNNAPQHLKTVLSVGVTLVNLQEKGDGPHFTLVNKSLESLLKEDNSSSSVKCPSTFKGPYKCRYCPLVTRREREMKRHVWKNCQNTPNFIKKKCKQGTSLEELGFNCQEDEVEDLVTSGVTCPSETEMEDDVAIPVESMATSPVEGSSSSPTGAKLKEPLVCAYCGIWYYREISLIKHMIGRCIIIPAKDKELLIRGSGLCDTSSTTASPKVLSPTKGFYKKVKGCASPQESPRNAEKQQPPTEKGDMMGTLQVSNEDSKNSDSTENIVPSNSASTNSEAKDDNEAIVPIKPEINQTRRNTKQKGKRCTKQKGTRCNRCHETFISAEAVLAHSSVHHGPKKGMYKCKLCHERFLRYKQLREHVWKHTQETPYKCHFCGAKFRLSDSILEHLASIHNYTEAHEKNLYKWLPGRNGKYRMLKTSTDNIRYDGEGSLEDMDTNLENLAEDMVVTDKIWTKEKGHTSVEENTDDRSKDQEKQKDDGNANENDNKDAVVAVEAKDQDKNLKCKNDDKVKNTAVMLEKNKKTSSKEMLVPDSPSKSKSNFYNLKGNKKKDGVTSKAKKSVNDQRTIMTDKDPKSSGGGGDDDDDADLFSGMGNLDSIIETVNLTDDSFLE